MLVSPPHNCEYCIVFVRIMNWAISSMFVETKRQGTYTQALLKNEKDKIVAENRILPVVVLKLLMCVLKTIYSCSKDAVDYEVKTF